MRITTAKKDFDLLQASLEFINLQKSLRRALSPSQPAWVDQTQLALQAHQAITRLKTSPRYEQFIMETAGNIDHVHILKYVQMGQYFLTAENFDKAFVSAVMGGNLEGVKLLVNNPTYSPTPALLPPLIRMIETTLKTSSDSKKVENDDEDTHFLVVNGAQIIAILTILKTQKITEAKQQPMVVVNATAAKVSRGLGSY